MKYNVCDIFRENSWNTYHNWGSKQIFVMNKQLTTILKHFPLICIQTITINIEAITASIQTVEEVSSLSIINADSNLLD